MSLFDDISNITNSSWSSTGAAITSGGANAAVPMEEQKNVSKKPEENKLEQGFKMASSGLQSMGQKLQGYNAPMAELPKLSTPNFNLGSNFNQQMLPSSQLQIPQYQLPQMQMPQNFIPQMQSPLPVGQAISDYRAKTNIKKATNKLDELLNNVYSNIINRRK